MQQRRSTEIGDAASRQNGSQFWRLFWRGPFFSVITVRKLCTKVTIFGFEPRRAPMLFCLATNSRKKLPHIQKLRFFNRLAVEATELLDIMERASVKPSFETYKYFIDMLVDIKQVSKLKDIVDYMKSNGCVFLV